MVIIIIIIIIIMPIEQRWYRVTSVAHTSGSLLARGTMFSWEAGVVRGEAICDIPVPVPGESVSDGSQVPSFGPLMCVTGVLIHYYR